jgi:hypothetical protein
MKSFQQYTSPKLDDIKLDLTAPKLMEASILKPDYVIGHKFLYKGEIKEMDSEGFKFGDIFTIVRPNNNSIFIGKEEGEFEKWLECNGKTFHIKGSTSYKMKHFNHVKESGDTPNGAQWEELIIFEYNKLNKQKNESGVIQTAERFALHLDKAKDIAKNFNKELSEKRLVSTGKGGISVSLSNIYTDAGASNKTPKTDIAGSSFKEKISLKKEGGSQLMSGSKGEAIATVNAALSQMGQHKPFAKGLTKAMEEGMSKLITKETVTSLNDRIRDGESDESIVDFQKKDADNKELSNLLSSYINNDSAANKLFSLNVILEASTGLVKFEGGPASANLLGKFSISDMSVQVEPITSINDSIIKKYASSVRPYVAFKKGGGNSAAYSAMRLSLKENGIENLQTLVLNEINGIDEFNTLLTEDFLEEGAFDMIKRAGNWAKDLGPKVWKKFQNMIKKVMQSITKALNKIASMGKKMFESLMNFLGLQVSHVNNVPVNVSL